MDTKYEQHGALSWCELLTDNAPEARNFYSNLFGWTLETAPVSGMEYTLLNCAGEQIGGIMAIPPNAQGMRPSWGIYVTVNDVAATTQLALEMGGKVLMGPQDVPGVGTIAVLQDPQGATINVIKYVQVIAK